MCNFSKKGDKTESFLAMTVVAAEQLIQKHGPKYPAIHFRKRSYISPGTYPHGSTIRIRNYT